jgi:hypothetical protein
MGVETEIKSDTINHLEKNDVLIMVNDGNRSELQREYRPDVREIFGESPLIEQQKQRFHNLVIPSKDVFHNDFRSKFQSEETIKFSDNISGNFDKEYNAVRFYLGKYPDSNTVSFYLNERGEVSRIGDLRGGPDAATLAEIMSAGGLNPEVLGKLGVTESEIESAKALQLERQKNLALLEKDSLSLLPHSSTYNGTSQNTSTVLQGQAQFIRPDGSTNGIYTFGAGPCSVLVAVAKDQNGVVTQVGMAHIDAVTPKDSINSFLNQTKEKGQNLEVYLISGEDNTALLINESVKETSANLVFSNIDRDGARPDAVVVDKNGKVSYGERMELANVNTEEMQLVAIIRQIPGQPLQFKRQP